MNFFENQERARKRTGVLVFYFILAIILIILAVDGIIISALIIANQSSPFITYNGSHEATMEMIIYLFIMTSIIASPVIIIVIILGTVFKLIALSNGGISVAEMVKAKPIDPNTNDFKEKRFINIVEEMSIASGIGIPKLYVMDESGINAFVAGIKPQDTVMVVTQGALDQLNRDELQGVIGHEFSHIFNSDMRISLRLMGILGGIIFIGQAGYVILRFFSGGRSRSRDDNRLGLAILVLGLGLFIVGYIGLFFGRLIKAAVSRQRELLADSSSVQFTRNPEGLVMALKRIKQSESGTYLQTKHVEDISHLCFCSSRWMLFQNLLATHPPIEDRVKILDPQGMYRDQQPKSDPDGVPKPKAKPKQDPMAGIFGTAVLLSGIQKSIGNPTQDHIQAGQQLLAQIPQDLQKLAHDPGQVALLFYALMFPQKELSANVFAILNGKVDEKIFTSTHEKIANLPKTALLPLIDIALPAFKANNPESRRATFQILKELASVDKERLFHFALLAMIERNVEDKTVKDLKTKYNSFEPVIDKISELMIFLILCGNSNKQNANVQFARIMKNFTTKNIVPPDMNITNPIKLYDILRELNLLAPLCKEKLIRSCLECASQDNMITVGEAELIRAIAACMGCPIPPIIPSVNAK